MKTYLKAYNALSAAAWVVLLVSTVANLLDYVSEGANNVYATGRFTGSFPHQFLFYLQLVNAVFEFGHSISGLVPSPIVTLVLQFSARLLITVGVSYTVPNSAGNFSPAYMMICVTWALAEIIRYGYYYIKLNVNTDGEIPYWVTWLRYSAFFVLYPSGLFSELYVVYLTLGSATTKSYYIFLIFALFSYIPGFITLYSYMIRQRTKVLKKIKPNSRKL